MNIESRAQASSTAPIGLQRLADGSYASDRSVFEGSAQPSLEDMTAAIQRYDISVQERLELLEPRGRT